MQAVAADTRDLELGGFDVVSASKKCPKTVGANDTDSSPPFLPTPMTYQASATPLRSSTWGRMGPKKPAVLPCGELCPLGGSKGKGKVS